MKQKEAIILGAGITGLVTAWKLANEGIKVTLIEKDEVAGGLCGTMDWDGWKFDYGAHGFFSKFQEITDFYKNNIPDKFRPRKVNCEIYIFNKLIKYPLVGAQVFTALSRGKMIVSGIDFFFTRLKALMFGIKDTEYLDEWIINRFGKTLYKIYFGPYIERIQKKDPHFLSKDIGIKKIPVFSIRQYLIRELSRNKKIHPNEQALFDTYYVKNGYGELPNFFFNELKNMNNVTIRLGEEVKKVELENNSVSKVETSKKIYDTKDSYIISTLPIEFLINSMNCSESLKEKSNKLEYSAMRFLLVKSRLSKITGDDWTMFNGEEFAFNRVSESRSSEFGMVPDGCSSLTFEFPLNKEDRQWSLTDEELWNETYPIFSRVFSFKKEDIIDYKSVRLNQSNPRMVMGYDKVLKELFGFLLSIENLASYGRQGLFTYINLDGCTKMAFDFCNSLMKEGEKNWLVKTIMEYHNIDMKKTI